MNKLLFELSSSERISILLELKRSHAKLSQISRKLNLTVAETARHLQRLCDARVIQKDIDGCYKLNPVGKLVLSLLSGLNFVSMHKDYFEEYDVSNVPYEFVNRMGELEEGVYLSETLRNLEEGENQLREAQQFIWILSEQILASSIPILMEKAKTSFDLRIILSEGKFPPETISRLPSKILGIKKKTFSKVNTIIILTEKYAVFCLPNQRGRIDYTGFIGKDPKFRKWCKDLFLYYWEKAKPFGTE